MLYMQFSCRIFVCHFFCMEKPEGKDRVWFASVRNLTFCCRGGGFSGAKRQNWFCFWTEIFILPPSNRDWNIKINKINWRIKATTRSRKEWLCIKTLVFIFFSQFPHQLQHLTWLCSSAPAFLFPTSYHHFSALPSHADLVCWHCPAEPSSWPQCLSELSKTNSLFSH